MCTEAQLRAGDPTAVAILTNASYNLPTKLPVGNYSATLTV